LRLLKAAAQEIEQKTAPDVGWQWCWIGFLKGLEAARKPTRNQNFRLESV